MTVERFRERVETWVATVGFQERALPGLDEVLRDLFA
jgi:hypothetical protein